MKNNTIRWLWRVPGRKLGYIAVLIAVQMAVGSAGVLYALLLRGVVNSAVDRDITAFRNGVILMFLLIASQLALQAVIRWLNELSRSSFENLFKQRLTDNILRKEYSAVSAIHSGEWINRLTSDTVVVANGYVDILPGLAGMVVKLVSALTALVMLDRTFAMVLFPAGAALVGLTYTFRRVIKRLHKQTQEADGRLRVFLQERIGSLMIIKSFAAERYASGEAEEKMAEHKAARMRKNRFSNFCNIGFGAAMQGMRLFGAVYCAYGILIGKISYGTLTAVIQLIGQIQSPFANISGYLPRWYAVIASAERLMDIERLADDNAEKMMSRDDVKRFYDERFRGICLENVDFAYTGEDMPVVLKGLSLEIGKGEYIAFTGHSGCGKSTVLKLLMSMYPPVSGEKYIITDSGRVPLDSSARRFFAFVPQGNALMKGSIRDIVSFAEPSAKHDDARLKHALTVACADEFVEDADNILGERGSGLSEGQMQRLAIARAVFSEAPVLLLDEATSALDDATEKRLLENLRGITDKTVIIVTHRKAALSICDRIIRFKENGAEQY